jgi:putative ABC transport system permease protein
MPIRLPRPLRRALALFSWQRRDDDMHQEMAFHVASIADELVRQGMPRADAERAARVRFGSQLRLKEQGHDQRRSALVSDLLRDVRHTGRGLLRTPGFSLAVVVTLALGIGGNTAMFSVIDQLLLRPLPYPDGDRIVTVYESFADPSIGVGARTRNIISPANWLDWQRESTTLAAIAVWRQGEVTLTEVGEPARLNWQAVSAEFFPLLGVQPLLGRTIRPDDDLPTAPQVVVLSYQLWQSRFAADPAAIGRTIQLNDQPAEIVGVMPESFRFIYLDNDLWGALRLDRSQPFRETSGRYLNAVARLDTGVRLERARAEMSAIGDRLAAMHVFNKGSSVALLPLREELTGQVEAALTVLYGAVAVLLAIACFNVANMLLARAVSRRRELAIRMSLGAGGLAVMRQLLVESLALAMLGGALGALLARFSLDALVTFAPPQLLSVPDLYVDTRVLLYGLAVSVLTGVVVGLVPAVLVARQPIVASIRLGGSSIAHAPRVRQALVVGQVAMTVVLLCGAGLLVRTVVALGDSAHGFDERNLLTMHVRLPVPRYAPEQRTAFYAELLSSLRGLPGVESAAAAHSLAVVGAPRGGSWFHRRGTPELPLPERPITLVRVVTPGYFRTLRIPVLRGREFTEADNANPAAGFIVNDAFAKQYLDGVDPFGEAISVWMQEQNPYLPIIGVVGDVSEGSLRESATPTVFYSHRLMAETGMTVFVRAAEPMAVASAALDAVHRLDRRVPVTRLRTYEDALAESIARERVSALVSGGLAVGGLLLASFGLYGLLTFIVAERTKEIGIRIALGARVGPLTGAIVAGGLRLVAIGALIGIGASLAMLGSLRDLLFGVTPYDASTYAGVIALLCVVATVASYVPARWAARVEPLVALRQD